MTAVVYDGPGAAGIGIQTAAELVECSPDLTSCGVVDEVDVVIFHAQCLFAVGLEDSSVSDGKGYVFHLESLFLIMLVGNDQHNEVGILHIVYCNLCVDITLGSGNTETADCSYYY